MPKYQLPSINCSICLPNGTAIAVPDGVIDTDAYENEYPGITAMLEDMVRVRNAYPFDPKVQRKQRPIAILPKAQAPDPKEQHAAAADSLMGMFQ